MTNNTQLELSLNAKRTRPLNQRRSSRVARAKWWFSQMRQAVENAVDWHEGESRDEQIWLTGTDRNVNA
jgi:hypothetical protein